MTDATAFQDYYSKRYVDRRDFYDRNAKRMMYLYRTFKGYMLIAAAAIPALVAIGASSTVAACIAASIAAAGGIEGLFKFHELWLSYRRANESLLREYFTYETRAGIYGRDADPERAFVSRCESIISQEGSHWLAALESSSGGGDASPAVTSTDLPATSQPPAPPVASSDSPAPSSGEMQSLEKGLGQ